jgi:hypothetical protein
VIKQLTGELSGTLSGCSSPRQPEIAHWSADDSRNCSAFGFSLGLPKRETLASHEVKCSEPTDISAAHRRVETEGKVFYEFCAVLQTTECQFLW